MEDLINKQEEGKKEMEFIDLKTQYKKLENQIQENINKVLIDGNYILGEEVKELEKELAEYVGVKYCATCSNGTDALTIALMAIEVGKNDAVFVPTFTFYSTAEVVSLRGATPIFIDSYEDYFNMDAEKLENTIQKVIKEGKLNPKAIIAVDLFGQPANYDKIKQIAKKYNLFLIEDGAQGFGGSIRNKKACSFGDIATTSFFPAKPLGCYGDGGAVFTDNEELYKLILSIRVHGKGSFKYDNVRLGLNSRLDTIQAAVLLPKLKAFKEYELDNRNKFANLYKEKLQDYVKAPKVPEGYISSWAQYTILLNNQEERNYVQTKMKEKGRPTMVYYPKPLHKQTVYKDYNYNVEDLKISENLSERVLSLPMHPYLSEEIVNTICNNLIETIKEYRNEQ